MNTEYWLTLVYTVDEDVFLVLVMFENQVESNALHEDGEEQKTPRFSNIKRNIELKPKTVFQNEIF